MHCIPSLHNSFACPHKPAWSQLVQSHDGGISFDAHHVNGSTPSNAWIGHFSTIWAACLDAFTEWIAHIWSPARFICIAIMLCCDMHKPCVCHNCCVCRWQCFECCMVLGSIKGGIIIFWGRQPIVLRQTLRGRPSTGNLHARMHA